MKKYPFKKNIKGTLALKACPLALIFAIVFTIVFGNTALGQSYEDIPQLQGIQSYKALYDNISFTDTKNHWGEDSINRASALSITRGLGEKRFNPNGTISREEAIAIIIRLMGMESDAQLLGQSMIDNRDTGGAKILQTGDYWGDGYIRLASNLGIITPDEKRVIETLTERERTTLEDNLSNRMSAYEDNESYTAAQINNIRNQLRTKLEKSYTWKKPVSREQVAVWVARAEGLVPITGTAQQMIYNLKDWNDIKTENLPLIEGVLQKGLMKGTDQGRFLPKDSLTRAQMTTIIDNLHIGGLERQGYNIKTGIVDRIDKSTQSMDGATNLRTVFLVKNDDGTFSALIAQESNKEENSRGFIAYKDRKLGFPSAISEKDYIRYYINPQGEVVLVETLSNTSIEVEGYLQDINHSKDTITIKDYYDRSHSFKIASGANVTVNGLYAKLEDLLYGQELTLKIANGNVVYIDGYIDTGEEGYIHPGERIVIGKVLYIDRQNGKITFLEDNKQGEYIIDSFTPVIKNNSNVGINSIREGDLIRLEFDEYNGSMPIKAYIAYPDRQLANLYKAQIVGYNPTRNEIILEKLSYYDNTQWKNSSQDTKLPLSSDSSIYINGRNISKELLKSYLGREAYIATNDNFGKEEAMKVVFKTGYENKYYNSIQEIAFGEGKLKVDYNEMYFDESTIIIKDGRLIHPYNLKTDDNVFVISHGTGTHTASLISIEGISVDTGLVVYRGRIDDIMQYGLELYGIDIIEGTEKYTTRRKTFNISEDTKIIDTRDDEVLEVTVEAFTNSRFLKDRYRWDEENYIREYAYAVAYGDMVLAIDIIDRDKEGQVISGANIKDIDRMDEIITLKDIRDWNDFRESWNINRAEINLDVSQAIFIKNGRPATLNDIRTSDSLYIIRRNDFGYIVICR